MLYDEGGGASDVLAGVTAQYLNSMEKSMQQFDVLSHKKKFDKYTSDGWHNTYQTFATTDRTSVTLLGREITYSSPKDKQDAYRAATSAQQVAKMRAMSEEQYTSWLREQPIEVVSFYRNVSGLNKVANAQYNNTLQKRTAGFTDDSAFMRQLEKGRAGWSSRSLSSLLTQFDVSRFPDYENMAEPYLGYIFMSRPNINLDESNIKVFRTHRMTAAFANDPFGATLLQTLSDKSPTAWLPIVTSRAMNYSTQDIQIKTMDKGQTFYGHSIKYGKYAEDHKMGGSISIDFRNDRYLSLMKTMYLWLAYIYIVTRTGDLAPRLSDQRNAILDYPASLYYVVTRRNGREIVYWEKIVGIFPYNVPFSIFNYNDEIIMQDRVNIDFAYSLKCDPMDPEILLDINYLSGLDPTKFVNYTRDTSELSGTFMQTHGGKARFPNSFESPMAKGYSLASAPFVRAVRDPDNGSIRYFLEFLDLR